jgi:hypothetical protein
MVEQRNSGWRVIVLMLCGPACEVEVEGLETSEVPKAKDAGAIPTAYDSGLEPGPDVDVSCGGVRCRPPSGGAPFCEQYGLPTAQPSCFDEVCVYECSGLRNCETRGSAELECRRCQAPTLETVCGADDCGNMNVQTGEVEASTCPAWPNTSPPMPFLGSRITISGRACRYQAHLAAGVAELGLFRVLEDQSIIAQIPEFGGTCAGVWAPTGAVRWMISCPSCQFVLRF